MLLPVKLNRVTHLRVWRLYEDADLKVQPPHPLGSQHAGGGGGAAEESGVGVAAAGPEGGAGVAPQSGGDRQGD
jgi:hypothetical protein